MVDSSDAGKVRRMINKDIIKEGIGRRLIHEPVAGKIAHSGINRNYSNYHIKVSKLQVIIFLIRKVNEFISVDQRGRM